MAKPGVTRLVITVLVLFGAAALQAGSGLTAGEHWEIAGTLTEACTCAVPCTCNFGEGPSPHHYCYTVFSLEIEKGHYGEVKLDSLHLAVGHAQKNWIAYIDERASEEQSAALKAIATRILGNVGFKGDFETASITQEIGDRSARVQIGKNGGFEANYIMGMDKKTPVVVENNTTFNIPRTTKTKTSTFRYQDSHGNTIETGGTNGNQGRFDWTDQTSVYLR